ncbi:putative secondary metabolism biosynthetic enzyme [Pestalotiopsis sp. 9143b]|nr:putative secondary metabolism biosynthetic enzyme [Pestalotiopsis sp. 9143b]
MDIDSGFREVELKTVPTVRADLTNRVLPQMKLGDGIPGSLVSPPSPLPRSASPDERAALRFRLVGGGAIVTGGAGDLGFAASRALLEHGLKGLMIFDINPKEAAVKVKTLQEEFPGTVIRFTKVDVADAEAVAAAVSETARVLGSVDLLLNFAGMVTCQHAVDMAPNEWNRVMNVNTSGGFCEQREDSQNIGRSGGGEKSMSRRLILYLRPQVSYNVSKSAVMAMVKSLAAEWAYMGIRVNSISPGYMDTILNEGIGLDNARNIWLSRNPMRRMGQPDELTGAIVLLASRAGSYINGADIVIDGGQTLF